MAMGRGFRAFHTNDKNPSSNPGGYSVVLEQRGKNDVVLFENYAVATMSKCQCTVMRFQQFDSSQGPLLLDSLLGAEMMSLLKINF